MNKYALFAYNGENMCFVHVLLNALDLQAAGHEVGIIIEGSTVTLVPGLLDGTNPFAKLFEQARNLGLIKAVCKACSVQLKVWDVIQASGLPIGEDMSGHAGMRPYIAQGYQIITF